MFWLWQTFSLCSKFQIVMLGKSKLKSFSLLIFSFDIDEAFFFLISIKKNDVDSALIKYSLLVIYY